MKIPEIDGLQQMTPLEMNGVHFSKTHDILTPEILKGVSEGTCNSQ